MNDNRPLRSVSKIDRNEQTPSTARLYLSCGHSKIVTGFPLGNPPPCFRVFCDEKGCC